MLPCSEWLRQTRYTEIHPPRLKETPRTGLRHLEKLLANGQFFVGAQMAVIKLICNRKFKLYQECFLFFVLFCFCFLWSPMLLIPAQIKPESFESKRRHSFLYPWRTRLMFTCVLGRYVASTVVLVPKPSREGADCGNGQETASKCTMANVYHNQAVHT